MGGSAMSSVIARILRFPLTRIVLGVLFVAVPVTAMQIGLHGAWNFTQGGIFGVAVSGNESRGLLQARLGRIRAPFWQRRAAATVVTA